MVHDNNVLVLAFMLFDEGFNRFIVRPVKGIAALTIVLKKGGKLKSGRPVSMPVFAFTIPFYARAGTIADKWNYSTVRSADNLSQDDNTVMYGYVRESMTGTGAGSTLYQYTLPATYWDATASPDWTPTIIDVAKSTCAAITGVMNNDKNTYPFPPNTNFDFERGLPVKIINYNDAGTEVSETAYTYTRTGSPYVITGFKFDYNGTMTAYAKYKIYATTGELVTQSVSKVYDSPTLSLAQTSTVNYYYNSAQHKLVQQQLTNSNGIILNNYTKYVKDYTVSPGTDSTANALYHLQNLNINLPVETYSTVTQNGSTNTTAAQLAIFRTVNPSGSRYMYLPFKKMRFVAADGVSNFTPSTISSGIFSNDSRYITVENDLAYDFTGYPLSVDDNNKHVQSVITDHITCAPVAAISNARYDEIAYNDFNSEIPAVSFTKSAYTYSGNSRTGQFALSLEANTPMTKVISKNGMASNYIFSIWVNTSVAGTITVSLTNSSSQTFNYSFTYSNTLGAWKYYELKVPLTSMSSSFTAQFQSNNAILIDDVWFYPDVAEVASTAYDPVTFQKTAQTNTNGVSNYFTYDSYNRLTDVLDQDKNILSKKSYYFSSTQYPSLNFITINMPVYPSGYVNVPYAFGVSGIPTCLQDQVTASWTFGDGSVPVSGLSPAHTYTTTGTYTITLILTSPFFSQKTLTQSIIIQPTAPVLIPINYTNNLTDPNRGKITSATFTSSTHTYTFTETDLINGAHILQGNYSVSISIGVVHAPALWKSMEYDISSGLTGCWPITSGNVATFTLDMTTSTYLNLNVNTTVCPLN